MRAVQAERGELTLIEMELPEPQPGHVVVRPVATGICGSDLHTLAAQREHPDVVPPMVMGHEFVAEILDYGPRTEATLKPGTLVCSVPMIDGAAGPELVGLSPTYPGGFAEHMLLQSSRLLEVPNGLDPSPAALTEPLAVGIHAVRRAHLGSDDVPLVLGCGPVGLAVIAGLRAQGHRTIVASDFSASRRDIALRAGASTVIDPAAQTPYELWMQAAGTPFPSSPLVAYDQLNPTTVVFDCVGAAGLMAQIMAAVPTHTRIVVVGVCAVPDSFVPVVAVQKELSVQYVFGYHPEEFAYSLALIAEGRVDVSDWITQRCGLEGVAHAFADLANPDQHCKILVETGA